jgi:hypothetical protein
MNPVPLPSNMVRIQEADKITKLHYVQVEVNEVILNYGARCFVVVYDENRNVVDRHFVEITGADYDRWIADDDIINLVLEKMGFQRYISAPVPAPEAEPVPAPEAEPVPAPEAEPVPAPEAEP